MNSFRRFILAALGLAGVAFAMPLMAQATRTWVSGVGDDANPCSRTAPCKTFAGAISKTATGGEINCLDPAGYGAVNITKSITIDCEDTQGSILASSTTGVIVNGASAVVNLRGLSINGGTPALPGVNGVRFLQGSALTMEKMIIFNFTGASPNGFGVVVNATSGTLELNMSDVTLVNNGTALGGGGIGIVATGSSAVRANLVNVRSMNNVNVGMRIDTTANIGPGVAVMVRNSEFSGNGVGGIIVNTPAGTASGNLMLVDSVVANNVGTGINAVGPTGLTRVGNTTITGNTTGIAFSGGATLLSFGDNRLIGNPIGFGAPANGTFSGADILKD